MHDDGARLGFEDVGDDDLLTTQDVASRMGYSRASSLRRWLKAAERELPPCVRRGRYRGAVVKAWYAGLSPRAISADERAGWPSNSEDDSPRVLSLQAQREMIRSRIGRT